MHGIIEYALHRRRCRGIPIRIHVNGTRGKSTVTRLIAAGLRAGGVRTIAKTTGSAVRIVFEDGSEKPFPRLGPARITEQLSLLRIARKHKAQAVVVECMALQPYLQWFSEQKIIRATVSVITNVRADHLDLMGPTVGDVALAMAGVIPNKGTLFTERSPFTTAFSKIAEKLETNVNVVEQSDIDTVSDQEMAEFGYVEHKSNVALALAVCRHLGVDRDTALTAMTKSCPDVGALRVHHLETNGKSVHFANAFAANDPETNIAIWKLLLQHYAHLEPQLHVIVVNSRSDRVHRSKQLGRTIAKDLQADLYFLTGTDNRTVLREALANGIDPTKIVNLGFKNAAIVFEEIMRRVSGRALIVGLGNIKETGEQLAAIFEEHSHKQ